MLNIASTIKAHSFLWFLQEKKFDFST